MGMTDKQFNAYLRALIDKLDTAIKEKNIQLIVELREQLQKSLEE